MQIGQAERLALVGEDVVIERHHRQHRHVVEHGVVEATGWQQHTIRSALTGLRKKGHTLIKDKLDGVTHYAIAAAVQS